jgi:hypothetical protein
MAGDGVPPGYTQFFLGGARVVAAVSVAPALRDALAGGTLHEFGARHPRARRLSGRGVAFAVPVALVTGGSVDVVIRHNRHGGMLAALRGDFFFRPREPLTSCKRRDGYTRRRFRRPPCSPTLCIAPVRCYGEAML